MARSLLWPLRDERIMPDVSHGFHIFRDGNAWCAVGPHFRDLMQDKAGFGDTPQHAYSRWKTDNSRDPWWRDKPMPDFDRFTVHDS